MDAVLDMEAMASDLSEDFDILDKIQSTLDVLREYEVTFVDQKAVCQAQIRTLVEKYNVSLDERYPVASFTQRLSGQNFDVAQEALGGGIASTAWSYIKKALEILGKIFKWIFDAVTGIFKKNKKVDKQVNDIRIIRETNENLESFLKEQADNHKELDRTVDQYRNAFNELSRALLNDSSFLGAFREMSFSMMTVFDSIDRRVKALEKLTAKNPSNNEMRRDLKSFSGQTPVDVLPQAARALIDSDHENIHDYFDDLKNHIEQLRNDKQGTPIEWEIASRIITNPSSTMGEVVLPNANAFSKSSRKLFDRTKQIKGDINNKSLAKEFNKNLYDIVNDARGCLVFARLAVGVITEQMNLIGNVHNCEAARYSLYMTQGKRIDDKELKQKLSAIHAKLKKDLG